MAQSPLAASMLAYMRSLQISEAVMSGVKSDGSTIPIEVLEKGVRGQSSHAAAKAGEFKPGGSNPQMVDHAMLPDGCEWLEIRFSLQVLPHAGKPSATDTPEAAKALEKLVKGYAKAGGFETLAELYVGNIANGRFAWRNRFMSDEARVEIKWAGGNLVFNPLKLELSTLTTKAHMLQALVECEAAKLDGLILDFAQGLSERAEAIEVRWFSKLPEHSEVFPSQEYNRSDSKREVSRVYASIPHYYGVRNIRWATMHSQKIGAAIRCIDHWHGANEFDFPVPVNPYAGVQEAGIALRYGKSDAPSFYDLKRKPKEMTDALEQGELTKDAHFFVANLVRGGVYGDKE